MRLDKFLWCVRVFRTREDSSEACRLGRVAIGGGYAKASREVKAGDVLSVRKGVVTWTLRVLALTPNRLPAKDVARFVEDITPQEERDKLLNSRGNFVRERGTGRPTKKERRDIDELLDFEIE